MSSASFSASTGTPPPSDDGFAIRSGPLTARRRLVLLHGWGADADDLLDLGEILVGPEVSVVALRAPYPHPGGIGRQWYDLLPQPDWSALPEAREALRSRLVDLGGSVPLAHTALLGFSQGAAMALDVATGETGEGQSGLSLAALIACSGYPHPDWVPARPAMEVLLTHGEQDPMVPFAASEAVERMLEEVGGSVRRLAFNGGHGIDPSLFPAMRAFLEKGWQSA